MFKRLFEKIKNLKRDKKEIITAKEKNPKDKKRNNSLEQSNRFLKFYYRNKDRLNKERRSGYTERKKSNICVRCRKPVVQGIVFCSYHQQKQVEYNNKARKKLFFIIF